MKITLDNVELITAITDFVDGQGIKMTTAPKITITAGRGSTGSYAVVEIGNAIEPVAAVVDDEVVKAAPKKAASKKVTPPKETAKVTEEKTLLETATEPKDESTADGQAKPATSAKKSLFA